MIERMIEHGLGPGLGKLGMGLGLHARYRRLVWEKRLNE